MNSAEKIINRFGGECALARLIGKRQSTVSYWGKEWHDSGLVARQAVGFGIWIVIGMASTCRTMPELRQRMVERFAGVQTQMALYSPLQH